MTCTAKMLSASRRCAAFFGLALALALALPAAALAFGFPDVDAKARQLAAASYRSPPRTISKTLAGLSYDQYRDIRYERDKTYWRNAKLPFELAFFHQGMAFDSPVKIHEVAGRKVQEIRFDPRSFHYGANEVSPKDLQGLGFAGFRVHYPVNTSKYKDEVLVFLGASYFRAIGKGQVYGLSARGLAIDTALHSGEEFPQFVEFWIERPGAKASDLTVYALLDSRRVTGAYRFVLKPGSDTAMEVKARLYLREHVAKLGIAPLTSMYFFGENQRPPADDYRPEVHDSDGLSIQSGTGEWIWRPLVNPKRLLVTSYALNNPQGFGLMQRDRRFASYEDLEARYEARPSAWVETKGEWGAGRIELVQIPTPDETNDNVVVYWVPDAPPRPGAPFDVEYRLLWQKDADRRPPLSWAAQTRRGHGWVRKQDDSLALSVDFEGPALKALAQQAHQAHEAQVEAVVSGDANARLIETNVYRHAITGGWRMTTRLRRNDDKKPVELRAYLRSGNNTLSETWSYILPPE